MCVKSFSSDADGTVGGTTSIARMDGALPQLVPTKALCCRGVGMVLYSEISQRSVVSAIISNKNPACALFFVLDCVN